MDGRLLDDTGIRSTAFPQSEGPLVPDLCVRVVTPDLHLNDLTLADDKRSPNGEVEREPRLHAWGMLRRVNTVEDILVQLCGEVSGKAMDLSLSLQDRERHHTVLAHGLLHTLGKCFQLFLVGVRQVAESEHILGFRATRVRRAVDLHNVGEFVRMHLLVLANTARDTLVGVDTDLVPEHLTTERNKVVGVCPWHVDTVGFEEFLCRVQTLR